MQLTRTFSNQETNVYEDREKINYICLCFFSLKLIYFLRDLSSANVGSVFHKTTIEFKKFQRGSCFTATHTTVMYFFILQESSLW